MPLKCITLLAALTLVACGQEAAPTRSTVAAGDVSKLGVPAEQSAVVDKVDAAAKALYELSLPDLDGKPQALAQWKGKILVVNYWATWCPPCREEMPAFSRLNLKYSANGVQFVGISIDSVTKVQKFSADTPVSYPLLIGGLEQMKTVEALGNLAQGLPFTVILDRQGLLQSAKLGRFSEAALDKRLAELTRP